MKKFFVALLLMSFMSISGTATAEGITPFYRDIATVKAKLVAKNKTAICIGLLEAKDSNNIIELTVVLRKDNNGSWRDIKKWTITGKKSVSINKSYVVPSSGKYRVIARGSVKTPSGNVLEKISVNSSIVAL